MHIYLIAAGYKIDDCVPCKYWWEYADILTINNPVNSEMALEYDK